MAARGCTSRKGSILAVENKGFKDCIHGRSGSIRLVLLMDLETLEEFGIAPGRAKENITTRGIELDALALGERLRIGGALFEVTQPYTSCDHMDEIRAGLDLRHGHIERLAVSMFLE